MRPDEPPTTSTPPAAQWGVLAVFLVLVVGGGILIGFMTAPGEWYAALQKPSFNPPNWIFGPVWTLLYVLIAITGWRTWKRSRKGTSMFIWWVQLALNFAWSPTFFGLQQVGLALAIIIALLASILTFIAVSWRSDRMAAWLFVPYLGWVAFATLLNASIYALN